MMFASCRTQAVASQPSEAIFRLSDAIRQAEAIVVGAGAGLSASAGFVYDGARFQRYFADFEEKYGFHDMYSGGFYPFPNQEAYWAYWSRFIWVNRYMDAPKPVYRDLLALVKEKDYFVLTTNVDHCFQKNGFDQKRLFYTQGDYGLFQCSVPCCQETWENEPMVKEMLVRQKNMGIPPELIPRCPRCRKPLTMNLRADDKFVQDQGWYQAAERYEAFLQRHQTGRVLYWELGVGFNTPGIIKYPFWHLAGKNPHAIYACVNLGQAFCVDRIQGQTICINRDIGTVLKELRLTAAAAGEPPKAVQAMEPTAMQSC